MSGREWPDEIPLQYKEKYGLEQLRDAEEPVVVPEDVRRQARSFAEKSVETVKQLIFPIHKLG